MVDYIDEKVAQGTLNVPVTGRLKIGTDDDLARLNKGAWKVLERVGFKVYSRTILDKLRKFGAKANRQWRQLLAERRPPKVNEYLVAEVHEVVERAKREIGDGTRHA